MRNSYWLVVSLLVLECVVLLIHPAECFLSFIPVSVHTALNLLTLIVKIKSIIFKILLGLKLMGVEGFIMRRKRSITQIDAKEGAVSKDTNSESYLDWKLGSLPESQRTELLMAWRKLEKLLGEEVRFQEDVCIGAIQKYGKQPVAVWAEGAYMGNKNSNDHVEASSSNNNKIINGENGDREREPEQAFKWNYSYWISTVLGSALGSPYACHILEKQLNFNEQLITSSLTNVHLTKGHNINEDTVVSQPVSSSPLSISNKNLAVSSLQSGAFS